MKSINYFYFGLYFLFLSCMSASSIFTKVPLIHSKFFFFCYSLGQITLEVLSLVLIAYYLQKWKRPYLFQAFIGATFILFILHFFDTLLDRILDLSIWDAISLFVIHETLGNFLYLLDASGVPLWGWAFFFIALLTLPFLGIFLYHATAKIIKKKPLKIQMEYLAIPFFSLPAALLFWDFSASRVIHPNTYSALVQSLPWKCTFLQPENIQVPLLSALHLLSNEDKIASEIALLEKPLSKKPNIYLFVIESFRKDAISLETTPNLCEFQKQCVQVPNTFANGNASHLSWFSIFHSQFSYYWQLVQQNKWQMGSPPLAALKKLGYQIHLYSSAQLEYYGMEQLLFGKEDSLLTSHHPFHHTPSISAAQTDAQTLDALTQDLRNNPDLQQGQVFILFWDSTHFDYSWPKEWVPKFTPFATDFAYFTALYSKHQIPLIHNRYKNAVHYIDHLFGKFLNETSLQEDAIVIVTGDHGEEFCEKGHLFHGSHLIEEQIAIPIMMKLGKSAAFPGRQTLSQMDIFPSVFDHLCGEIPSFLQGESILKKSNWPFIVTSRFNAGRSPYEFCLHNAKYKLTARFNSPHDIGKSESLQIISLQNRHDQNLPAVCVDLPSWVHQEFGNAWQKLFSASPNLAAKEESLRAHFSDQ